MHGELAEHAESVLVPLLLPDAPVVVWWPGAAPEVPAKDPVGALAQRRVTDAAAADDPHAELAAPLRRLPARRHRPRLDPHHPVADPACRRARPAVRRPSTGGEVVVRAGLAQRRAAGAVAVVAARRADARSRTPRAPGITGVRLDSADGAIEVSRPDGRVARLMRPGQPERQVSLLRRETAEIIAEELRRLDPDEVYGEVIGRVSGRDEPAPVLPGQPDDESGVTGVATGA